MRSYDVRRLVFSSSATVYGAVQPRSLYRGHARRALYEPYGWTKWMIEQILADVARADAALSVVACGILTPSARMRAV